MISPRLVNTASVAMSRLAMTHYPENSDVNDIVGRTRDYRASDFGGPRAWGAPYFNVQGYSPIGDSWLATPMQCGTRSSKAARRSELAAAAATA